MPGEIAHEYVKNVTIQEKVHDKSSLALSLLE